MKKCLFFTVLFLFIACTKEEVHEVDNVKPIIKIVYPTDSPTIPVGYPLCMKVLISDTQNLSIVWLEINDGHGFKKEYTVNGKSIEIIEKYTPPPGITGNLVAKFFATDETGNMSFEEIKFGVSN